MNAYSNEEHRYDDIINLPHPVSQHHPQMPLMDRAAQFAPFAALTGLGATMRERARLTEERIELDEEEKAVLDEKLWQIQLRMEEKVQVSIRYFVPDEVKLGGAYVTAEGFVRKIDPYKRLIFLSEGQMIPMDDILTIDQIGR
ncbi:MAG: hypothetical protein IJ833_01095 [Lachnospiraceae bacterium]|nr:hypothetical protein [Lachnospiraceae bacterium]